MFIFHDRRTFMVIKKPAEIMKQMKSVLLVFDDQKELDFIEENLMDNGFRITKADTLEAALVIAERMIPDLIVLNTSDRESDIKEFGKRVRTERLKDVSVLSLVELEEYLKLSEPQHVVIKPVRPKLLLSIIRGIMNHEEVNWLPAVH